MCGHTGVAGLITPNVEKTLRALLVFDSVRGEHSTGAAFISRYMDPLIAKAVGNPFELFDHHQFNKGMGRINRAIIGHNRYATVGDVTRFNAHPFEYGHIVGAHNGTLKNKHKFEEGHTFKVDSQALLNHIAVKGIEDAIGIADGAWALVYWNAQDETLNFLRNKERPLLGCFSEDNNTLFWASEAWMLSVALSRNNIKHHPIFTFDEDVLHSIHLPKAANAGPLKDFEYKEVKSNAVPFVMTQTTTFYQGGGKATQTGGNNSTNQRTENKESKKRDAYSWSKKVFLHITSKGHDRHKSLYLSCLDDDNVLLDVRLYLPRIEWLEKLQGKSIIADIGAKFYHESEGEYYKVEFASMKVVEDDEEAPKLPMYKDYRGNTLSETEWKRLFSTCAWCQGNVNPNFQYGFSKDGGDCLCHECIADDEVKQYVVLA